MPGSPSLPQAPAVALPPPRYQTLRVIGALVLREMGSTYGRSPGGYIWAILSPLGTIVMMSIAFSLLVHAPALGTSFILFYATGFLPFSMFSITSAKIGRAVRYSKPLLAYPRVTWIDSVIARFILNVLTELVVFCLIIAGIFIIVDTHTILNVYSILIGLSMMAAMGLGVGMMNCLLIGYFPVWTRIWEIVSRPLMIASGIFYLPDDLAPQIRDLLWWNPLIHGIALVREGFYPTYHSSFDTMGYGFGLGMILTMLALIFLRRGHLASMEN
ncbi:ABC transporter permease [Cereibacter sp. SYSU M97828]|nr:ABC transporter permease [Cereibacter flavus]